MDGIMNWIERLFDGSLFDGGIFLVIGIVGGVLVFGAILLVDRKLYLDDPVGAVSVHGVGGLWGLLAVNLSNPSATLGAQLLGILVIFGWVFGTSLLVWLALKYTQGIRLSELEEYEGADVSEIGLEAYPEFVQK